MTDSYAHDLGRPHTDPDPGPRRRKPLVFVAATYAGNPLEWAHGILRSAQSLWAAADVVPVVPHLRLGVMDTDERRAYERDLIRICDAVVVVGGRDIPEGGEGVDPWIVDAFNFNVPVFEGPGPLIEWARNR